MRDVTAPWDTVAATVNEVGEIEDGALGSQF